MNRKDLIEARLGAGEDVTFTFVGDSITFGWHYCTADETYVAVFVSLLAKKYPNASVIRYDGIYDSEAEPIHTYKKVTVSEGTEGRIHVIRSGVGGNTVRRVADRFFNYTGVLASGTRSDFIFTMLGINDSIKSDPQKYVDEDRFEAEYRRLLKRISEAEPGVSLVIMTPTTYTDSLKDYVDRVYKISDSENIPLVDMYTLWREHYQEGAENFGHRDWLTPSDRVHPTPASARAMGEYLFDVFFG